MSNLKSRKNCLCVAKSGKRKSNRGRGNYYRWYTFQDLDTKEIFSIPGDLRLKVSIFGIAEVEYQSEKAGNWNPKWDAFIIQNLIAIKILPNKLPDQFSESELPRKLSAFGLKYAQQHSKYQIEFHDLFRWRDVQFFDGFIKTKDPELSLQSSFFPESPIFYSYFNNINRTNEPIKGGFELSGKLEVGMVKTDGEWGIGYKFGRNSKLDLISYDLKDLERARTVAEHDRNYFKLVAWAKKRLNDRKPLDPKEIEDQAKTLGILINPDDLIEEVCMKPEYKKSFFDFIKGLGVKTYATIDGFFVELANGNIIWEMPKYGASTYVFGNIDPHLLMQRLRITQRAKIYSDSKVAASLQYIGRRRHPEQDENGEYEENWQNDVKKLAGV